MSESTSQALFSLAGFQVTIIGRFWVTAEDLAIVRLVSLQLVLLICRKPIAISPNKISP